MTHNGVLKTFWRMGARASLCCLVLAGCGRVEAATTDGPPPPSRISDLVRWEREIPLEENDKVINVFPNVTAAGDHFLVADAREVQFRIYGRDGRLASSFGAKGEGPAEFRSPVAALQRSDGSVLAVDIAGKLAIFGPAGDLRWTGKVPLGPVYDADLVNDTLVLMAGRIRGSGTLPLLHVVNLRTGAVERSFFEPHVPSRFRDEYTIAGFVDAEIQGETAAVTFALSDTVYLFSLGGQALGKLPIPARHFRRIERPVPRRASRERVQEWVGSFSSVSNVHFAPDGGFLVQYFEIDGLSQNWRLVRMSREGKALFEGVDTPQLLATANGGRTLYFVKPGSETPNVWSIASLR